MDPHSRVNAHATGLSRPRIARKVALAQKRIERCKPRVLGICFWQTAIKPFGAVPRRTRVHEKNRQILGKSWHGRGFMHGRRGKNAPTSAGRVPWVCARIVEAAASRDIHPWSVPPPRLSGGFGQNRGSGACTFLGRDSPCPICPCRGVLDSRSN